MPSGKKGVAPPKPPKPKKPPAPPKPPKAGAIGGKSGDDDFKKDPALGNAPINAGTGSVKKAKSTPSKNVKKGQETVKGTGSGGKTGSTKFSGKPSPKKSTQDKSREINKKTFGIGDFTQAPIRKKRSGGTSDGGRIYDRLRGGDTARDGGSDGGRLGGNFRDRDLVGSRNEITDFDGSEFSGGFDDVEGGGGGSGSSLAGREAVGRVGELKGQSLEEVVYGVKKRGRKVGRARGE